MRSFNSSEVAKNIQAGLGLNYQLPRNFGQMVDVVLEHNGTPRHRLFEYPYRDDTSQELIDKAEQLVRTILKLAALRG